MASKAEHLQIVAHNYRALVHLSQPDPAAYPDWCIVLMYYMALHYLHAYLAQKLDDHPSSHIVLQPLIQRIPALKPLYVKYRHLEDDSRDARYEGRQLTICELRNGSLRWFHDIQRSIAQLLKLPDHEVYNLSPLFPSDSSV